ncbi:MAG: alkyl hydroperoxide reductase subunit F [Calditrichaeota bacterium]|nr:alkyl hydroperoxide reductase subunit F [Calditrichota bacterium]
MLDTSILDALREYTSRMSHDVTLVLGKGEHASRAELLAMLQDVASVSPRISLIEEDSGLSTPLCSAASFTLLQEGRETGIVFSGVPGGHEFSSLVLALLQSGGVPLKLDPGIQAAIRSIQRPLHFETVVSLSCHNCPDVVQALNQMALLNPLINHEMIDGGVFPELVEQREIQGVPAVFLDGKPFANGKLDVGQIVEKVLALIPADQRAVVAPAADESVIQDVVVVGGGPAGVAASVYAARKGLSVMLIADRLGGQVKDTMGIENLISVPRTTGPELSNALEAHLGEYPVTVRKHLKVHSLEKGEIKSLVLSSGEVVRARTVIVATGARWRELGVPGERENIGHGVAYCPHCDGPFFKGKDVAVIGGGNSGVEAALDLAGIVNSVTVLEYLPELKADKVLVDQLQNTSNITVHTNVATRTINAQEGKVVSLSLTNRASGEELELPLAGVFIQIGLVPNSAFLKDVVELTRFGEVVINDRCETSEPGIFACGDVTTVPWKQIVIAVGEGAKASLAAFEHLLRSRGAAGTA